MREQAVFVWNGLLDLIYPPRCLVCGLRMDEGAMCAACQGDIQPISPPFCDRCGAPISAERLICEACETGPEPPFAWSQAMGLYQGTLRHAIHRLKYDGKAALAAPLGHLLARSLDASPTPLLTRSLDDASPSFDAVVPVPLHPSRLRERGFNQAEKIARALADERGWRLDTQGLHRIRRTRSQTTLSPAERAENVQGAFAVPEPLHFYQQRVLLIDDVLTTMSTMRECARVVREAGATRLCLAALARGG